MHEKKSLKCKAICVGQSYSQKTKYDLILKLLIDSPQLHDQQFAAFYPAGCGPIMCFNCILFARNALNLSPCKCANLQSVNHTI